MSRDIRPLRIIRQRILPALITAAVILSPAVPSSGQEPQPSDDQVNAIADDLYCPVCPNTPLDVCETLACSEWREQIREQIAAGMSKDEIIDYFVEQYGQRVLATPQRSGFTLLLWVLPFLGVGLGLVALARVLRRWQRRQPHEAMGICEPAEVPAAVRRRIEKELGNLH